MGRGCSRGPRCGVSGDDRRSVRLDEAARHRMNIERDLPLSRFTTVGIGGLAYAFARPTTVAETEEAVRWAAERALPVVPIGLGSNLLVSDAGVDALVLRLSGELARARVEGETLRAGGGAP